MHIDNTHSMMIYHHAETWIVNDVHARCWSQTRINWEGWRQEEHPAVKWEFHNARLLKIRI